MVHLNVTKETQLIMYKKNTFSFFFFKALPFDEYQRNARIKKKESKMRTKKTSSLNFNENTHTHAKKNVRPY